MNPSPTGLRRLLAEVLQRALRERWGDDIPSGPPEVAASDNLELGDLSSATALRLASQVRRPPREIAGLMRDALSVATDAVASATVDGPGFLNIRLSLPYLAGTAARLAVDGLRPMLPAAGEGRRALVEFVSSNPTGPLTVGHCRQAVLGEAISGLLEAVGWEVEREYYYNDAGRQTRLLGLSLAARYRQLLGEDVPVPEGGYEGSYVSAWAEELLEARGSGLDRERDRELFRRVATERAMESIEGDLELLGIRFDRYFRESELIPGAVERTLHELRELPGHPGGLVYEEPSGSGKLWLRLTALGRPEDRVVRRESGEYTYRMPDIAYHLEKLGRGYDLSVDVFGSDHIDTSRDVTAVVSALRPEEAERLRVVIHQFVTLVREGRQVKMSTRAGEFVTLRGLVEEVGSVDVTRYLFLTRRAEAHMEFDLDLARSQSEENPVYYVQYAHARISGILRTAEEAGIGLPGEEAEAPELARLLDGPRERELMRQLESVPPRVAAAAAALEPHRLTELLAELATGFHRFYQDVRVVDPGAPEVSSARLLLCEACRRTVADVLGILGVCAPERM